LAYKKEKNRIISTHKEKIKLINANSEETQMLKL
jgi:hypothetical protein